MKKRFGLTESSGFCAFTTLDGIVDDILTIIGKIYPMSIRIPMKEDNSSGDELPDGEIGEICFQGPQIFLG